MYFFVPMDMSTSPVIMASIEKSDYPLHFGVMKASRAKLCEMGSYQLKSVLSTINQNLMARNVARAR